MPIFPVDNLHHPRLSNSETTKLRSEAGVDSTLDQDLDPLVGVGKDLQVGETAEIPEQRGQNPGRYGQKVSSDNNHDSLLCHCAVIPSTMLHVNVREDKLPNAPRSRSCTRLPYILSVVVNRDSPEENTEGHNYAPLQIESNYRVLLYPSLFSPQGWKWFSFDFNKTYHLSD